VKEIADLAKTDPEAAATFQQFGNELAGFLSPWIQSAEITQIIMGGNVAKAYKLFQTDFESELERAGLNVNVKILADTDLMAILGSGRLADEHYYQKVLPLLKFM
jgi:glucokinase